MKTATRNVLKNEKERQENKVSEELRINEVMNDSTDKKDSVDLSKTNASVEKVPDSAASESQDQSHKNTTSPAKKRKAAPEKLFVEYAGRQIAVNDVIESAKAHYKALYAKENGALKTIEVYVKPEENVAYYVANGKGGNKYKVGL